METKETIKNGFFDTFKDFYNAEVFGRTFHGMDKAFLTEDFEATLQMYYYNLSLNKGKTWLLIQGGIGTGKTTTAVALCKTFNRLYWNTVFREESGVLGSYMCSSRRIIDRVKSGLDVNELHQSYALMSIDDIGYPKSNVKVFGDECNPIVDILMDRYDRNVPTILTTNLIDKELLDELGERVLDRMREKCMRLVLNGKSYRESEIEKI